MEQKLQDLLSKPESDLDFFSYTEIGRVRRIAHSKGKPEEQSREFERILRQALQAIRSKERSDSKAA